MATATKTPPAWDLSDLYLRITDPQIEKDKQEAVTKSDKFTSNYKGKINKGKLSTKRLLEAILEYENILELTHKYLVYASLVFFKDTASPTTKKFYQSAMEFYSAINSKILWFELEIVQIPKEAAKKYLSSKKLTNYHHYLKKERKLKPFTLSENEEIILSKKSQTGSGAFTRLYDELITKTEYELTVNGKKVSMNNSEITALMSYNPDRDLREKAAKEYTKGINEKLHEYAYILNTLLHDKKINDEIRGYEYPEQSTFLRYEIEPEMVASMSDAIVARYDISREFYRAKKNLMGHTLHEWDRYSPLYPEKSRKYSWHEARKLVLSALEGFSDELSVSAEAFFDRRWIDAAPASNKRHGAFCSSAIPSVHPYVFMNFTGELSDVYTLAHELGHAVHASRSSINTILNYSPSTAVAEIASIFSEVLLFEKLYKEEKDKKIRAGLLADFLQSKFATIYRQNAFYLFEKQIHNIRRSDGELSIDEISDLYQNNLQPMFGNHLKLTDQHKAWWAPVIHFYHYNFYVFTYAFGLLLTLSLYGKYKEDKQGFVENYINALSLGGSKSPKDITKLMGVDVAEKNFWDKGLSFIENYVNEFDTLVKSIRKI